MQITELNLSKCQIHEEMDVLQSVKLHISLELCGSVVLSDWQSLYLQVSGFTIMSVDTHVVGIKTRSFHLITLSVLARSCGVRLDDC